jgi:hypothetical protein
MATDDGDEEHALSVEIRIHSRQLTRNEECGFNPLVLPLQTPVTYMAIFKLAILYTFQSILPSRIGLLAYSLAWLPDWGKTLCSTNGELCCLAVTLGDY